MADPLSDSSGRPPNFRVQGHFEWAYLNPMARRALFVGGIVILGVGAQAWLGVYRFHLSTLLKLECLDKSSSLKGHG